MVVEGLKPPHKFGNFQDSAPPGFVSRTFFTLKRVDDNEETFSSVPPKDASRSQMDRENNIVDPTTFKKAFWHRPWIVHISYCSEKQDFSVTESLETVICCPFWF